MKDPDIERWTAAWRDGTPIATDLARAARRERRLLTAWIAFDWITGAAFLALAGWIWFAIGTPAMRFAAAGIVILTVVVLAFTVYNWRGSLAGDRASAADFLALARKRNHARLRYIRCCWWVLAADLVVIAGAVALEVRDEGMARLPSVLGMTAIVTIAAAGILLWWGGRERRRTDRLEALQKAMDANTETDHE